MQAYGFRSFSLPDLGFFSPFPRGTGSLSVSWMYLALPDGAGRFRRGVSYPALLRIPAHVNSVASTGLSPALVDFPKSFELTIYTKCRSYYPSGAVTPKVWALSRSLATTEEITDDHCWSVVFSSCRYLDVSVPYVCLWYYYQMMYRYTGLPHSDTRGSQCLGHSPQLFAALRVLLRLQEPRHPPYALRLDLLSKVCYLFNSRCRYAYV